MRLWNERRRQARELVSTVYTQEELQAVELVMKPQVLLLLPDGWQLVVAGFLFSEEDWKIVNREILDRFMCDLPSNESYHYENGKLLVKIGEDVIFEKDFGVDGIGKPYDLGSIYCWIDNPLGYSKRKIGNKC